MPKRRRRGRGLAHVVRLHRALGDQGVGALGQRLAQQELELAGLVAAGGQAGAVVALDPEFGAAECSRETLQLLERGGQMGVTQRGKRARCMARPMSSGVRTIYRAIMPIPNAIAAV